MTQLLVAIIITAIISAIFLFYSDAGYNKPALRGLSALVGFLSGVLSFFGVIAYGVMVVSWIGAKHQADIINREYGTNYTQAEVFYASNVIDTVRELDRKRVELNGNLIRGGKN